MLLKSFQNVNIKNDLELLIWSYVLKIMETKKRIKCQISKSPSPRGQALVPKGEGDESAMEKRGFENLTHNLFFLIS
jgi:hypothetical protein